MNSIERHSKMIAESIASWNLPTTPKNLYEPLRYFLTLGGKRMRPVLTLQWEWNYSIISL